VTITPLVIYGRIVTCDDDSRVVEDGALYVGADERIDAVQDRGAAPPAGFDGAAELETGGTVYPGLMDLHNHIAYNTLPLWASPTRTQPWERRDQWPGDASYKPDVSLPANAWCRIAGEAVLKYVETKAVIGGTTAIQGSAKVPHYDGWLVRNIEKETFRTGAVSVRQSVRMLASDADFVKYRDAMTNDHDSFIYHLSEGTAASLTKEFTALQTHHCLDRRLIAIHCTALGEVEFGSWSPESTVVWSPFSNLWLYGATTAVDKARHAGQRVCLGTDWSPSGSKNLLGELKVADICNRRLMDGAFSDEELCRMATSNPADALAWDDRLGRLREGLHGDVLVTTTREDDPWRNLITAIERDVLFVAINGYPFYGTVELMRAARAEHAEPIRVGRRRRAIVLVYPGYPDADMTWVEVKDELDSARGDPRRHEQERRGARPGGRTVRMEPDKPWDAGARIDEPTLETVPLPEPDALTHDAAFLRAVEQRGFHGGVLDELRSYYARER
jgi:cytosine/adenosine deaminase-related metal-dependent hydrolase